MQKLTHPNVVPYFGMSLEHEATSTTVRIFEEFVHGSNFSHFLSENLAVDLSALRHYVASALEALTFMHQHNFVHRDIRETSIYLESSGRVRLGDFSIDKRIIESEEVAGAWPEMFRDNFIINSRECGA